MVQTGQENINPVVKYRVIDTISGRIDEKEEFIVVDNEREAREISELRREGRRQSTFQAKNG